MELINNTLDARREIEECIKRNGFAPEHNFGYYTWLEEPGRSNVFLKFPGKSGILAQKNEKLRTWYFISLPVAKENERLAILAEAVDLVLSNYAVKINLETTPELKKQLTAALKGRARTGGNNYIYCWPVFDMKNWDGHELKGKKWKKIRNIRNRFYKSNKVQVKDSKDVNPDKLRNIVSEWVRRRTNIDRPFYQRYFNMIKNNFDGVLFARTMIVNKEPCSITAGWKIPNSSNYYSGIGLYNYKFRDIGEIANLDDLFFLKKKNFDAVDFGGSGSTLLKFKQKFKPTSIYKTYSFPVFGK